MYKTNSHTPAIILLVTVFCSLLLIILTVKSVRADLPPIPEATPRPTATTAPAKPAPRTPVAEIVLNLSFASDKNLHSTVQWQDSASVWHDVEGWRGTVVNGHTFWWVEEKDWGHGPFRWYIYTANGADIVAISDSFYLPGKAGERKTITVEIR